MKKETPSRVRRIEVPSWVGAINHDIKHTNLNRFVITGGLGSAKTHNSTLLFLSFIRQNPSAKTFWVIAPIHSRHKDSIVPMFVNILRTCFGKHNRIHYILRRSSPMEIEFLDTGQIIYFHSAERPEDMVSATLGGYYITEPGLMKRIAYEKVENRTRDGSIPKTLGILEGTPEGDNWYMDEFNFFGIDKERKLRRFILHTSDNAHNLEPGYVERQMRLYEHSHAKQRAYLFGEFHAFNTGNVFAQFAEHRNVIEDIEPLPLREVHLCFDFNASPLTWSAWQVMPYERKGRRVMREICVKESSLKSTNLFEAAVEIGLAFPAHTYSETVFKIWGDRTGHAKSHKSDGTDFSNLKKYLNERYRNVQIMAKKQITPIRASVDITNRLFLYELLLVCESCKNIRRSYNVTSWKDGKADIHKPTGEDHTHHSDGARYRHYWMYKDFDPEGLVERQNIIGVNPA